MGVADIISGWGKAGLIISSTINMIVGVVAAIILIVLMIIFTKWYRNKKAFNIPVTIWIPRSDNTIVDEISAKGGYFKSQPVGGVTTFRLKRKGLSVIDIPPPSSKYLVGLNRHLYLIQKGMDDFEPVIPKSFINVTTADGKKAAIVDLKCVNQDATAWLYDNQRTAKERFTLSGFWNKYKDMIQIMIFVFIVFLAIYINWSGLKDVVVGLKEVAEAWKGTAGTAPIVS